MAIPDLILIHVIFILFFFLSTIIIMCKRIVLVVLFLLRPLLPRVRVRTRARNFGIFFLMGIVTKEKAKENQKKKARKKRGINGKRRT